jgi:predicted AlkP superfamily phosphohydrolase/phosphomutase
VARRRNPEAQAAHRLVDRRLRIECAVLSKASKVKRTVLAAVAGVLVAVTAAHSLPAQKSRGKTIVLGFDGADHKLVTKLMAEGKLPNLSQLAALGGYSPLRPTIPAQTPVSWSTFSTGLSPGRTQIFDFLKRDPKTYRPEFAVASEGKRKFLLGSSNRWAVCGALALLAFLVGFFLIRWPLKKNALAAAIALIPMALGGWQGYRLGKQIPEELPTVTNNRQGTPFWEAAGKKGLKSVVMHVPVTFPAVDYDNGKLVSGLGVPDVRGRIGTPSYYTSDPFFAPRNKNEFSVELVRLDSNKGTIATEVFGPYNKLFKEPPVIKIPMKLSVLPDGTRVRIEPEGSEPVTLKPGEWSPWVRFVFPFNSLVKLRGIGRFHLISVSPEIQLYLSPINFDPVNLPPSVKISSPGPLAKSLADKFGLYKTMGWSIDTWSMSEEVIDEKIFLEDVSFTFLQYRKMMNGLLEDDDIDLFVQIYEYTDRVGHVMWRLLDPEHPAYNAEKAALYANSVERSYKQMDAIVGDAMKKLGKDDLMIVLSDHGFATWRRSVNYNTWLVENGFMAIKGANGKQADLEMLFGQGEFWANVDWSKTKAYAMGLGEIYVNLEGREGKGIVKPGEEYDAVRAEIKKRLLELTDPKTGKKPVYGVYTREEAYGSFDPAVIPDIFVTNSDGYRVAWQSSLGVVTPDLFEDNNQVWSGDHCSVDPAVVPGILFANRPFPKDKMPGIADVPATIYKALGVTPPEKLDGVPIF